MNRHNGYTTVEQSKNLAKILSVESADMCINSTNPYMITHELRPYGGFDNEHDPCWSLAALLDVLESEIDGEEGKTYQLNIEKDGIWWNVWYKEQYDEADPIEIASTEELIDACYNMILKLHELKML